MCYLQAWKQALISYHICIDLGLLSLKKFGRKKKSLLFKSLTMIFCYSSSLHWLRHPDQDRSISLLHSQAIRMFRKTQNLLQWEEKFPMIARVLGSKGLKTGLWRKNGKLRGKKDIRTERTCTWLTLTFKTPPSHYKSPLVQRKTSESGHKLDGKAENCPTNLWKLCRWELEGFPTTTTTSLRLL